MIEQWGTGLAAKMDRPRRDDQEAALAGEIVSPTDTEMRREHIRTVAGLIVLTAVALTLAWSLFVWRVHRDRERYDECIQHGFSRHFCVGQ